MKLNVEIVKHCSYSTAFKLRKDVETTKSAENEVSKRYVEEVLAAIADKYMKAAPPENKDDLDSFLAYMKEMRLIITGV